MKLFSLDWHISTTRCLQPFFNNSIEERSLSEHCHLRGIKRTTIPYLEPNNWSNIIKYKLNKRFQDDYRHELDQYDAFLVCHPPMASLLYSELNKPIIIVVSIRYETPFHNSEELQYFNHFLSEGIKNKQIYLIANSLYDKKYIENFIDTEVAYIPSFCDYHNIKWKYNNQDKFILNSRLNINNSNLIKLKDYKYEDWMDYRGAVHIPYQTSYMTFFEHYSANIPLYVPSKSFLIKLQMMHNVLKEVSWNNYYNLQPKSFVKSKNKYDPNNYRDINSFNYWLDFADYYNTEEFPFIKYFNSIDELQDLLNKPNGTPEAMEEFNKLKKERIQLLWNNKISDVIK